MASSQRVLPSSSVDVFVRGSPRARCVCSLFTLAALRGVLLAVVLRKAIALDFSSTSGRNVSQRCHPAGPTHGRSHLPGLCLGLLLVFAASAMRLSFALSPTLAADSRSMALVDDCRRIGLLQQMTAQFASVACLEPRAHVNGDKVQWSRWPIRRKITSQDGCSRHGVLLLVLPPSSAGSSTRAPLYYE